MEGTHTGAVFEEPYRMWGTHVGAVHGGLSPVGRTPRWSRGRGWGVLPLRRKEQQRQRVVNCPQPPFPHPPALLGGRGWRIEEQSWAQEEGRDGGEDVFRIWFYFSLSYSDLIGKKLNRFPWVESVLPMTVIGELSLPVLISTHEPFIVFFSPLSNWGREWWSSFGGHLASSRGQPTVRT